MGDLSNFERGRIVGARSVGAAVTKLERYYVYRERQFLRLSQQTRIMGRQQQRRGTVG
jgi:arginine/ornithine N-succinyltransferase beta subunit